MVIKPISLRVQNPDSDVENASFFETKVRSPSQMRANEDFDALSGSEHETWVRPASTGASEPETLLGVVPGNGMPRAVRKPIQ